MYCRKCGTENADNAYRCTRCGEVLQQVAGQPSAPLRVPNYLAQAILVTLFCCLPFGIVSIVYAAQVNGKLQAGDIQGALDSSNKAKTWCWVSFGVGLVVSIGYAIFYAIVIAGAAMGS